MEDLDALFARKGVGLADIFCFKHGLSWSCLAVSLDIPFVGGEIISAIYLIIVFSIYLVRHEDALLI